jgi:hypothetical protein
MRCTPETGVGKNLKGVIVISVDIIRHSFFLQCMNTIKIVLMHYAGAKNWLFACIFLFSTSIKERMEIAIAGGVFLH